MRFIQLVKRAIDLCLATLIIIVTLPVFLLTGLLILILEGRPIFYVSRRYVSATRTIPVYKFRSMARNANSPRYRLKQRFMRDGFLDIPLDCEVYTPIGRILERTQIVELPQMFNVLFHGMSLIGNRPLPHENLELLRKFPGWHLRFDSPGGISGIAQVAGKLSLLPEERLNLEIGYARRYRNGNILRCDLVILYQTLRVILFAHGLPHDKARLLVGARAIASAARRKEKELVASA